MSPKVKTYLTIAALVVVAYLVISILTKSTAKAATVKKTGTGTTLDSAITAGTKGIVSGIADWFSSDKEGDGYTVNRGQDGHTASYLGGDDGTKEMDDYLEDMGSTGSVSDEEILALAD